MSYDDPVEVNAPETKPVRPHPVAEDEAAGVKAIKLREIGQTPRPDGFDPNDYDPEKAAEAEASLYSPEAMERFKAERMKPTE